MKRSFAALVVLVAAGPAAADPDTLTVLTYGSFASEWGPGAAIKQAFEAECGCSLEWVTVDDAGAILGRLRLEGPPSTVDVALGLDTNLMVEAEASGLFAPHGLDLPPLALPVPWDDPTFVPFDYGTFAVIYDTQAVATPPASLAELVDGDPSVKIILEDPRTSTPGLGFLLWMRAVFGDGAADAWRRLRPRVLTVTQGWSEAYGLFLEGEAPMVLSYTTSPAYHRIVEGSDRYQAARFAEGHYLQVEIAAMLKGADSPDLARRFLAFIPTEAFQATIPTGNWMYPVIALAGGLPEGFPQPPAADATLALAPEVAAANRRAWIDEWLAAMSE